MRPYFFSTLTMIVLTFFTGGLASPQTNQKSGQSILQLQTNYPSPIGNYRKITTDSLQFNCKDSPPENCSEKTQGEIFLSCQDGQYYYCEGESAQWLPAGVGLWIKDETKEIIYPVDMANSSSPYKLNLGTTNPEFKFTLGGDGSFLAKSESCQGLDTSGNPVGDCQALTTSGAGIRFIWYPLKSALRAGEACNDYWDNANIGEYSVALGSCTKASAVNSTVSGGKGNLATDEYATVSGGNDNYAEKYAATVSGGEGNKAQSDYATISGGIENIVKDIPDTTSAEGSTIAGGMDNVISNSYSFLGGGKGNEISGEFSVVSGGWNNIASGAYATIGGGGGKPGSPGDEEDPPTSSERNTASAIGTVVSGGVANNANGEYSVVSGGKGNNATGKYSVVAGGQSNSAIEDHSVISGGQKNKTKGNHASIAGGIENEAGVLAFVAGGYNNKALGSPSIIWGTANTTSEAANWGMILGSGNSTDADFSTIIGRGFTLTSQAEETFVWGYPDDTTNITTPNAFIIYTGNVGIGTAKPAAKLHVNGNIKAVLRNFISPLAKNLKYGQGGQYNNEIGYDVAELFETSEEVEVGDVLTIDKNTLMKLKKTRTPYEKGIIGIVSGAPAILFEGSELQIAPEPGAFAKGTKPPVALAGRILCKVTNENGPIEPGDFLTSSSLPGYAMKATDREKSFGTVVGKALEPFTQGSDGQSAGRIMILVTLQ